VLQGFNIQIDDSGELVIMNPPTFEVAEPKKANIETSIQ